jgi:diaminopimelate epimerase
MAFSFVKYHGAGNDFIMINGFDSLALNWSPAQRAALCRRHYGIGADGIIVIKPSDAHAFEMVYYNADGELGSLCGNGSRCALAFAHEMGIIDKEEWVSYLAFGGKYQGRVNGQGDVSIEVPIGQSMVKTLGEDQFFVDTGSPHLIILKKPDQNWIQKAYQYRWDERFKPEGCNVNYLWQESNSTRQDMWHIATYERGVEAPTEACGTGNIAALVVLADQGLVSVDEGLPIQNAGGVLLTSFKTNSISKNGGSVILSGPAIKTFEGSVKFQ